MYQVPGFCYSAYNFEKQLHFILLDLPDTTTRVYYDTMNDQSSESLVEIVGLELLQQDDLMRLMKQIEEMSFSGDSDDDNDTYAKDSIRLDKVTVGARRRSHYRRNSADSYANDSVEIARRFLTSKSRRANETKDQLPTEMVFQPLTTTMESPMDDSKDLPSTPQLGAKDLTKLKPHSLTNRAA